MSDNEIVIRRLDPIVNPAPDDEGWIKNAKGEVIGYQNLRVMTREEVNEMFPGAVTE